MANEKILVVDDDTNICELLRLYLTKEGYQVTTANDGEEGLDKFNQVKPDMVLLDVMMPGEDGFAVCRRIRGLTDAPILFLTARTDEASVLEGLGIGTILAAFTMGKGVGIVGTLLDRHFRFVSVLSKPEGDASC